MTAPTPHTRRGARPVRPTVWAALVLVLAAAGAIVAAAMLAPSGSAQATEQIDAQRVGIRALEEELLQIDAAAGAAADAASTARGRVADLRTAIRENTAALERARTAHAEAEERLGLRLRALYVEQPPSFVEVLVSSGSLSGAVDTHETLGLVSEQDRHLVEGIQESQQRLAAARRELTAGRQAAEREAAEAASQLAELDRLETARRAVLDQARGQLEGLIVEEQARQARIAALAQAQREAEAALRARAAAPPSPSSPAPSAAGPVAVPAVASAPAPSGAAPSGGRLERIAQCESGGNPRAVSPGGDYRGKYQFHPDTWRGVGGSGDPAAAPEAEQDRRAALLYSQRGASPWPICGA